MKNYPHITTKNSYGTINIHDCNNNLISKTYSNGEVYLFDYDDRKNIISEIHPNGDIYLFEWDDRGNIIFRQYPNGDTYRFEWDDMSNMISKTYPDGIKKYFNGHTAPKTVLTIAEIADKLGLPKGSLQIKD